eukprot:TRINITY_DN91694_c0_g1_i1.p1 TRINITY_DN91694_c0_g1~~TRINITY_DN91694_c0_g1_i1.p1  ORF type:complete len:902 (+),score=202.58 TRINITY_DN91694_c0_g1_i1:91-2796(+)
MNVEKAFPPTKVRSSALAAFAGSAQNFRPRPDDTYGEVEDTYEGVIKSFNKEKGFGFIRCLATFQKFGCDVFLHHATLGSFSVGDSVSFKVFTSDKGQPRAVDLLPATGAHGGGSASQQLLSALLGGKNSVSSQGSGGCQEGSASADAGSAAVAGDPAVSALIPRMSKSPILGPRPPPPPPPPTSGGQMLLSLLKTPGQEAGEAQERQRSSSGARFLDQLENPTQQDWGSTGEGWRRLSSRGEDFLEAPRNFLEEEDAQRLVQNDDEDMDELANEWAEAAQEEAEAEYHGVLAQFSVQKAFGFIKSPAARADFGSDIWVHQKFLTQNEGSIQVGESLRFKVKRNARGQAQAMDIHKAPLPEPASDSGGMKRAVSDKDDDEGPTSEPAASSRARAGSDDKRFVGTVKFFDHEKGYGFLRCAELHDRWGTDIYVHKNFINDCVVGDHVSFTVKVNKTGKPQALQVKRCEGPADEEATPEQGGAAGKEKEKYYEGVLKMVDKVKGFGFIVCQELHDVYDCDVWAGKQELEGKDLLLGDKIRFRVKVRKKGKPEAEDIEPVLPEDEMEEGDEMIGTIKSFDETSGYGFITSQKATEEYGRDVFLHRKMLKDFKVGDVVKFRVKINKQGRPQAGKLQEAPEGAALPSPGPASGGNEKEEEKETHIGEIKSFNPMNGFGFITCPALHDRFGRDVFLHESQYEGLKVGDRVSFVLQVKRGQPQALEVSRVSKKLSKCPDVTTSPAVAPASPPIEPSPAELALMAEVLGDAGALPASLEESEEPDSLPCLNPDQSRLSRRLLRACASARAESVQEVLDALEEGADANARDVTGQRAIMVSALNVRGAERKCKWLIEHKADIHADATGSLSVLQWARERINGKFAAYLEALSRGEKADIALALDSPPEEI